jgi:hypothetical protein
MSYVEDEVTKDALEAFYEAEDVLNMWEMPDQRVVINEVGRPVGPELFFQTKPTREWLLKHAEYLNGLSVEDRAVAAFYGSANGVRLINGFLRGQMEIPKGHGLESYLAYRALLGFPLEYTDAMIARHTAERFQQIINAAPVTENEFVVFRGSQYPLSNYYAETFISTTFSSEIAFIYAQDEERTRYFFRFTIPVGSHVLFLSPLAGDGPYESEIVLPYDSYYGDVTYQEHNYLVINQDTEEVEEQTFLEADLRLN